MSKRKMQSAADRCVELEAEIERLRAEKYVVVSGDSLRNDNEALQAEIERLELRVAELELALDFAEQEL